jgi:predicted  nucleic acid-binding Zn-ribbon protein
MTISELTALRQSICQHSERWQGNRLNFLGYYTVFRRKKINDTSEDILNSFYLSDLEAATQSAKAQRLSKPLAQYLCNNPTARIRVEEPSFLQQVLLPKNMPLGRWLSDPNHSLALMQQCAVNIAINRLSRTGGLFSVNGPPGTGKTTLLRDLIADLIVARAERLVKYDIPADAFDYSNGVYRLDPSLCGFEIVVASSNNGAVENVTVELPSLDAIAANYQERAAYFRAVAQSVRKLSTQIPNQSDSDVTPTSDRQNQNLTGKAAPVFNKLEEEEPDQSKDDDDSHSVWGLIAAVLGNKNNCNRFCGGFWYDKRDSIRCPLQAENSYYRQNWQAIRDNFARCQDRVTNLIQQRQTYADAVAAYSTLAAAYSTASERWQESERSLAQIAQTYQQIQQELLKTTEQIATTQSYINTIASCKPSFFCSLIKRREAQQYQQRMNAAQREFEDLIGLKRHFENNLRQVSRSYQQAQQSNSEFQTAVLQAQQHLERNVRIVKSAQELLGRACADLNWWERPHEELQLGVPWVDMQLNEARSKLFLAALDVHEYFIRNASKPIRGNLSSWVDMVNGDWGKLSESQVLALWQTFFLVVPVVSTTFASIGRLFYRLGAESLGWLLIDEAGQGTPQAAVGALQRVKRAVIVGDPLQIEPVFTLDRAIVEGLRRYFGINECWSPDRASIQSLADRANPYGTTIETETDPLWIGCPLWVHRRCLDPMFSLANTIAYNGKMVLATRANPNKQFHLGESCWIDISGSCQERHWVRGQGEKTLELLQQLIEIEECLPNLYIISPFRNVSRQMRQLLFFNKKQWAKGLTGVEKWIKRSVGTVHSFQGKESDSVILLLGADDNSKGAAQWAASKPNLLNVAATRAKYRFYIVGSKRLWSQLKYFDTACQLFVE